MAETARRFSPVAEAEAALQAWLTAAHLAAAALALSFAITHLLSATYHLERLNLKDPDPEATETSRRMDKWLRSRPRSA